MSIWPENTTKPITVISPATANISIYSKAKTSTTPRVLLPGTITYMGDDTWELMATFPLGEYVITVIVDGVPNYYGLSVITLDQYDLRINQELLKTAVNDVGKKVITNNSWKAIS